MLNLFAYRATHPTALAQVINSIGNPTNDEVLVEYTRNRELVVACWGDDGQYLGRDKEVIKLLKLHTSILCLGKTSSGNPRHPSRLAYETKLEALA